MIIPKKEAQPIKYKVFEEYTPYGNKLELLDGNFLPFNNEREKMLMLCLFNMGLQEFISILPQESKEELLHLLQQNLKEWFNLHNFHTVTFCLFRVLVKYDSGALGFRASKGHFYENEHPFCFTKQPPFLRSLKVVVFITVCINAGSQKFPFWHKNREKYLFYQIE